MSFIRIYHLPAITCSLFVLTFMTTYFIATSRKDVNSFFPYISDTGAWSPESCIFAQMLNILAVLMALQIYIRHRYIDDICESYRLDEKVRSRNKTSTTIGFLSTVGISIVGNFQEVNVLVVHVIGACLAFGLGNVWMWYQTWISFKVFPLTGTKTINQLRLSLTIICAICYNITSYYFLLSLSEFEGNDMTKWTEEDGGYNHHLISTVTEWLVFTTSMGFIATFTSEMKSVTFDGIIITVHKINPSERNVLRNDLVVQKYKRNKISPRRSEDIQQEFYI